MENHDSKERKNSFFGKLQAHNMYLLEEAWLKIQGLISVEI